MLVRSGPLRPVVPFSLPVGWSLGVGTSRPSRFGCGIKCTGNGPCFSASSACGKNAVKEGDVHDPSFIRRAWKRILVFFVSGSFQLAYVVFIDSNEDLFARIDAGIGPLYRSLWQQALSCVVIGILGLSISWPWTFLAVRSGIAALLLGIFSFEALYTTQARLITLPPFHPWPIGRCIDFAVALTVLAWLSVYLLARLGRVK